MIASTDPGADVGTASERAHPTHPTVHVLARAADYPKLEPMARGSGSSNGDAGRRAARRRAARSPAPTLRHDGGHDSDSGPDVAPTPPKLTTVSGGKDNGGTNASSANGTAGKPVRRGLGMPAWRQAVYLGAVIVSTAAVAYIGTVYVRDKETGRPNYIVAHVPFFFLLMGTWCAVRGREPCSTAPVLVCAHAA